MMCLKADTTDPVSYSSSSSLRRRSTTHTDKQHQQTQPQPHLYIQDYDPPPSPFAAAIILPFNTIGDTIYRCITKGKRKGGWMPRLSSSSSSDATASSSSGFIHFIHQDANTRIGENCKHKNDLTAHRYRLEQEIKTLQIQLREEIDLHLALASASDNSSMAFSKPLCQLPDKAQDILADIDFLEITVSKLEEESVTLQFQLSQERNERRLVQYHLRHWPSSPSSLTCSPVSPKELVTKTMKGNKRGSTLDDLILQTDIIELSKESNLENFVQQPNQLSEEMVRCMRNIFLCVADSSHYSSSGYTASSVSSQGHNSHSSIGSLSGLSAISPSRQSPSSDFKHSVMGTANNNDPYRVQGAVNWTEYIGTYSTAAEVSKMAVGEKQLTYAAEALKKFRLLVEQLAKVNPEHMNDNEKLAFWINLYNTLVMHGYLAYGVPGSDSRFFILMKKAAYTVGGLSISAIDIEHIILKMKPVHRPQMALVHKLKLVEEKRKFSIEKTDPRIAFALSCGIHSSPAVRIFRPESVTEDVEKSMKDYIQASVGISSKGKLLVPKLLHSYTKGIVEDSMLPEWICRFLCFEQAAMVRDSSTPRKQRLMSPRSFSIQPFDSTFRYLFLAEIESK